MILFFTVFSLAVTGGLGAPTAAYKFVKCNPDGDQANCITYQSAKMEWSPDLPSKLPATAAQELEAEAVADERDPEEEEVLPEDDIFDEDDVFDDDDDVFNDEEYESQDGESPVVDPSGEGSGDEGSAYMADWATSADSGSGEYLAENNGGRKMWPYFNEQKPAEEEMKEDHLLHP